MTQIYFCPLAVPAGIVKVGEKDCEPPEPRALMFTLPSSGSVVLGALDEVLRRILAVVDSDEPVPKLATLKLTWEFEPASPLVGLRLRFWGARSANCTAVTLKPAEVRSSPVFVPCLAVLLGSTMTQTYFCPLAVPAGIVKVGEKDSEPPELSAPMFT